MFSMTFNKIPVKVQSETQEKIRGFSVKVRLPELKDK